ncbi:MAG: CHRD domain-containing protein [Planctomycetota bacterium]
MHVHNAVPGSSGPFLMDWDYWSVEYDFIGGFIGLSVGFYTEWQGAQRLTFTTPEIHSRLATGEAYFNIHSLEHPPGEIRADLQIL